MRKGDWVKYTATWTKEKEVRFAEIVGVGFTSVNGLPLYATHDGYLLSDRMIIERRPGGGA